MSASRTASAAAKDQVARLLTLVPYLHARGQVRLEDAAKVLDVSPEQVLSDLKVLFMCGLPGGYPDDLIDVDIEALEAPRLFRLDRIESATVLDHPIETPPEAPRDLAAGFFAQSANVTRTTLHLD